MTHAQAQNADRLRLETIAVAAAEMRQLQREYFAFRDRSILDRAKSLESRLDNLLAGTRPRDPTPSLFGDGPKEGMGR
jgi:hypothetical protein